jgi:hypothetical protein
VSFSKILKLFSFGFALILALSFVVFAQKSSFSSKYKNPQAEGLFYVQSLNNTDERGLILSSDDKPISPKPNDPDAPTVPGFYLSDTKRIAFLKVEVIGRKVYFKTRSARGVIYEFRGTAGKEILPNFDSTTPVQFIKGTLRKYKRGKIVKSEKIKFGHAVIA